MADDLKLNSLAAKVAELDAVMQSHGDALAEIEASVDGCRAVLAEIRDRWIAEIKPRLERLERIAAEG